jgi:4-hydroxy-tetrahydrodipicolinate reductase
MGRMGAAITRAIADCPGAVLSAAWERADLPDGAAPLVPVPVSRGLASVTATLDVLIDFTSPHALIEHAALAAERRIPLVVGTTGLDAAHHAALDAAAREVAVLQAPNMSVGVNALLALVAQAARYLGDGFDLEIVETHHKAKRDAPSGTALALLGALEAVRAESHGVFSRHGDIGPRTPSEIGVQTVRGGDVVGEHTVFFLGAGERLELTHRATDRRIFAAGAVRAACFLAGKPPGRYSMADVLAG